MCLLLLIFVINILQEVHPSLPYKNLHKIFYTTKKTVIALGGYDVRDMGKIIYEN